MSKLERAARMIAEARMLLVQVAYVDPSSKSEARDARKLNVLVLDAVNAVDKMGLTA